MLEYHKIHANDENADFSSLSTIALITFCNIEIFICAC